MMWECKHLYDDGEGVKQNYTKTKELFEKSAAQDYGIAQYFLGKMYYEGQGVKRDKNKAKEYFKLGCNNHDENSCEAYDAL